MGIGLSRRRAAGGRVLVLLLGAGLVACGGGGGGNAGPTGCSIVEQNQFVYETMQDIYLWNDQVPVVDPADFASPDDLLDAIVIPEDRFSFITTAAADDAFFGDGQFIGIGLRSDEPAPDELRIVEVFEGSPADGVGLARGDRILTVNGRPIEEILAEEGFSASLGPAEIGVEVDFTWVTPDGVDRSATVVKAVVTIPPVAAVEVLDTAAGPVGYMEFRTFVEPATGPLRDAFAVFKAAGAQQVVLDLRYNSGGLLSVAQVLADLAGGAGADGQPIYSLEYNADNSFRDRTVLFRNLASSLNPDRLLFITTDSSASASEMVINGLEPFFDVVLIGATTLGKPVGQNAISFCDQVLRPVSFRTVNALGEGDFFDGLPVDCAAVDDLDRPLGDPAEASLAEALYYAENGACSLRAIPATQAKAGPGQAAAGDAAAAKPAAHGARWRMLDAD